jgi:hypothetical protein
MDSPPFSQACENNKNSIFAVLREELDGLQQLLELGSGTGQHGRYFAQRLPELCWQMTDVAENISGIEQWREGYLGQNLPSPRVLDVRWADWDVDIPAAIFTANSLHIMALSAVEALFEYLAGHAPDHNCLCVYGPFNYRGGYTSDSNARFDQWLAQRNPDSAIRDFEQVDALAVAAGYRLHADHEMPANNRLLVWHKLAAVAVPPTS